VLQLDLRLLEVLVHLSQLALGLLFVGLLAFFAHFLGYYYLKTYLLQVK
jgi:hypothetical protein